MWDRRACRRLSSPTTLCCSRHDSEGVHPCFLEIACYAAHGSSSEGITSRRDPWPTGQPIFKQQCCKKSRKYLWLEKVNPPKVGQQLLNQKCCCFPALLQLPLCHAADIGQSSKLLLQEGKQMSAHGAAAQREQIHLISYLGEPTSQLRPR